MKTLVPFLITLILICGPTVSLAGSISLRAGGLVNHPVGDASNSTVQVLDNTNHYTTITLNGQPNLTWMTVDSSTIVNPPLGIKNKIDSNLLNLTELVTEGYLQDNQTNVMISLSNGNIPQEMEANTVPAGLTDNAQALYTSKRAESNMNFVATRLNYTTIFELAENPEITHLWLDSKFQACDDQSLSLIKDPTEWAQIESSFKRTIDGSGIRIAILDTGIDASHPDFYFPNGTSKIAAAISFTGEPVTDGYGHGTHVASIAAGTGAASSGQYVGVAPGATLLNVKVLNNMGEGSESWIISGIQWAVDNNASIINMSFSDDTSSSGTDPLSTTINWATQQGVVCVVAAGDSGPASYTIGSPGATDSAITVGASTNNDAFATFSSTGPTSDNRTKPDVLAPGVDIIAARANGTSMGTPISQYYTMASGTSMAAAEVTGAAALLLNAYPTRTPLQIKMALANTAKDIDANVLQQGSGRIDVCQAINASILATPNISFGTVNTETTYNSNVTLQNLAQETFNVTSSVEAWHMGDETPYQAAFLTPANLTLPPENTSTIELTLNITADLPSGFFEGRINVTFDTGNIMIPFFFIIQHPTIQFSDISIIKAVDSKTVASGNVSIYVTVTNQGNSTETFNVTTYANTTTIQTTQTTLTNGTTTTLNFTWDTTSFPKGNYTISAYAWPPPNETATKINTFIAGWVIVTIIGDINGDYKVNLADLTLLSQAYGSKPGDPNWNPNADICNSGIVNLPDLVALAQHYGQHYP